MISFIRTWSSGYEKGEVPYENYEWKDRFFGRVGVRRVETKSFIHFENLTVKTKKEGYSYRKTSHWFIKFTFCRGDRQIWLANIGALSIGLSIIGKIFQALMSGK